MIYTVIGLGFVVIYKSSRIINFAHGQIVALGALILAYLLRDVGLPIWLGGPLALLIMAGCGAVIEYLAVRPMAGQPLVAIIVMTIGLAALLDGLMPSFFGGVERSYPHVFPPGGIRVGGVSISYEHGISLVMSCIMVLLFGYFFFRTRVGLKMRAVADGHQTARSCGIKAGSVFRLSWIIAALTGTIGGYLLGSLESVSPAMSSVGLRVFPVVNLAGLESISGCLIAGPVVGVTQALAAWYLDPVIGGGAKELVTYLLILFTITLFPYGIFGEERIERI